MNTLCDYIVGSLSTYLTYLFVKVYVLLYAIGFYLWDYINKMKSLILAQDERWRHA